MFVGVFWLAHEFQNRFEHVFIVFFTVGTDQVDFTATAFIDDGVNATVVIVDMNPVADVFAGTIQFWRNTAKNIRDLARNKLFDVLILAVVVAAVAYGRMNAK